MPAALYEFWGLYTHGTVICRKGLVKPGHVAAYGWGFINKPDLEAGSGQIKGCLYTADPSSHDHHIAIIV
jgi:hypothetical protein